MKRTTSTSLDISAPIARRDLVAILKYVNRSSRSPKCVDGSFTSAEIHLDRLAAAARMQ
jgi:hypothetical protein